MITQPLTTSSPATRVLGVLTLVGGALVALFGLVISDPDVVQKDAVRLMYVHVPAATAMYVTVGLTALASAMWLRKRTPGWDALAAAASEVGLLFTGLTLATGMIWGRPTWGVYWTWDARLTATALLFVLLLGYNALRRVPDDPEVRIKRAAVLGLLLAPNAIIVKYSVDWWLTLHQDATISRADAQIDGTMLFTLMMALVVGLVATSWLVMHRFRVAWLESRLEASALDVAIAERRAEAATRPSDLTPVAGPA